MTDRRTELADEDEDENADYSEATDYDWMANYPLNLVESFANDLGILTDPTPQQQQSLRVARRELETRKARRK